MAGVSLDLPPNRTVAVVGESGSGKTVISQAVLGILPANARITGGSIWFNDPQRPGAVLDLAAFAQNSAERRDIRGGRISIIFQEPMSSLSPLHTIGDQIGEALMLHHRVDRGVGRDQDHRDAAPGRISRTRAGGAASSRSSSRAACASAP